MTWGYMREYAHRQIFKPFCSFKLRIQLFCLIHDQVYIHDEICVYASLN